MVELVHNIYKTCDQKYFNNEIDAVKYESEIIDEFKCKKFRYHIVGLQDVLHGYNYTKNATIFNFYITIDDVYALRQEIVEYLIRNKLVNINNINMEEP